MDYRNGNYAAFYVAEPFNASALGAHATKDFCYYNMLRAWKGKEASFPLMIRMIRRTTFVTTAIGKQR